MDGPEMPGDGETMIGQAGAMAGIIFVVLVAIIWIGMWVTERRNQRKQRDKWERETREARARLKEGKR